MQELGEQFYRPYLTPGEFVVWQGRPEKGNLFMPTDLFILFFSIFWLGFALFWEYMAFIGGAPLPFLLFGAPFVLIGLYLLFGRFIQKIWTRKRTFYVVTNRRILVKAGNKLNIVNGWDLPPMEIKFHNNGNGTIWFPESYYTSRGSRISSRVTIENVADVARVQAAIEQMEKEPPAYDESQGPY